MKTIFAITLLFTSIAYSCDETVHSNIQPSKNPEGFKLISLEKGSIYQQLGFKAGDVIKTINGKSVNNPKEAMELTTLMKTNDKIEIELLRNGSLQKKSYQIK